MSFVLSLLIALPLFAAPLVYLATRVNRRAGIYLSLGLAAVITVIAGYIFWQVYANTPAIGQYAFQERYTWISFSNFGLDYFLGVDGLSSPLLFVSAILTVLVVIGSRRLIDHHEAEYYALIFMFEGAIMGVFMSLNLILFYIFWEIVLIPMFFFIGVWGGPRRKYAALKFIIFTFAGSTIMLLGFLYLYLGMPTPTFDIPYLAGKIPLALQYIPLVTSFIGFAVKLPLVPFHTWLPDAHVEAPSPISVLLAGVLLKMGGYGFLRISLGLFPNASAQYAWVFLALGLFSMFYGAVAAVLQKDLKKMIAFTSINHMGFVLFGAYATLISGNLLGIQGAIFQMFTHALAVGSLFMLSGYIQHQAGTREISLLKGLGSSMPRTAAVLVLGSAAAMGLPPFSSFLAEFMVIAAGISASAFTAISVLVPVITAGYFLWMIKRTVLSAPEGGHGAHDMAWSDVAAFAVYLIPLVILIVASYLILGPALPVAQFLKGIA
ncbi:MAG: NADH-quinone oxidoreductase subunit M [Nitrososphaerota archaeon]|nr:NADH-quinone oxidoreductase subunit M [Nitrososphaerota archaeon]MDG7023975.1 NADH-quinone oxidoreductase subunit M [Nitrososphaerota archaeon]